MPSALLPCEPLDTPDLRYLNHNHAPVVHLLKDVFDIQLYNEVWFNEKPSSRPPKYKEWDSPSAYAAVDGY